MLRITPHPVVCLFFLLLLHFAAPVAQAQQQQQQSTQITPPEKFFGFQLGADRKMARWDKIVEYFSLLEKESGGRMKVINMGPTTMGNPFLMAIITSPANMAKLERLRQINLQTQRSARHHRGRDQNAGGRRQGHRRAVHEHARHRNRRQPDGAGTGLRQLARNDEEAQRILDNVISIMVPSFNPDGQIMVTDWYRKTLGHAVRRHQPALAVSQVRGPR